MSSTSTDDRKIRPVLWFMGGGLYGATMILTLVLENKVLAGACALVAFASVVIGNHLDPTDGRWRREG